MQSLSPFTPPGALARPCERQGLLESVLTGCARPEENGKSQELTKRESEMSDKSDAFARQVEAVVSDFEASLSGRDWSMRRDPKRMRDEIGNVYTVQSLTLINGPVRLLLDPNGYDIPGADGVMDLYLLPPYDPVATLYLEDGQ